MVMGSPRKGLKVTYCTDTRPVDAIAECAKDADLFICEGMYGEEEKLSKAKEHKHMMMREAAELAKEAQVHEMWLTVRRRIVRRNSRRWYSRYFHRDISRRIAQKRF